jgi:hypothetical protein
MMAHRPKEFSNGPPKRLPDAFWMVKQKGERTIAAVCEVWTHRFGWELRLIIGGHQMQMTSVVQSDREMHATVETWKAAMLAKGWRSEGRRSEPPVPGEENTSCGTPNSSPCAETRTYAKVKRE